MLTSIRNFKFSKIHFYKMFIRDVSFFIFHIALILPLLLSPRYSIATPHSNPVFLHHPQGADAKSVPGIRLTYGPL